MMKRMLKMMMIALLLLIGLYANDAVASTIDTLIQKMSAGTTKNAVLDVLFFDKTTIWVLIATFFVAVGMVNMASEIGSHFTGASVGNSVGNSAFATISGITVGAASKAIKSGKAYNRYRQAKKDAKGNMSSPALGVNNFVEGSGRGERLAIGSGGRVGVWGPARGSDGRIVDTPLTPLAPRGPARGSDSGENYIADSLRGGNDHKFDPTHARNAAPTGESVPTSEDNETRGRAPINPKVATAAAVAGADKIKTVKNKAENAIQEAGEAKEKAAQAEEKANESTQRIDSVKVSESTPPSNGAHNSISDIGSVSVSSANPLERGNISDIGSVSVSSMDKPK